MARSTTDVALLLDILCGPDAHDPFSLAAPHQSFATAIRRSALGLRVAVSPTLGGFPVEPDVLDTVNSVAATLAGIGFTVIPSDFELPAPQWELSRIVRRAIGDSIDDTLAGLVRQNALVGDPLDAVEQATALLVREARSTGSRARQQQAHLRSRLLDEVARLFGEADILLGPVTCVRAVPNGGSAPTMGPSTINGETVDPLIGWSATWPWNLTGNPAVAVPAALVGGTPVAVQLIGRRHADADVLSVAAAIEAARPWRHWYDAVSL
jgi:Asp-tRNA(Asn)/Glu-tRNA(Gln) amidotransferase A subunit family amidase